MIRGIVLLRFLIIAALLSAFITQALAQEAGTLHGQVTDPSGAVLPQATVTATSATGQAASALSDHQGLYTIQGLQPGQYTISAEAKDFTLHQLPEIAIAAGESKKLDIALDVATKKEEVTVEDEATTSVDTAPTNNASATILKGKDLDVLSDDPDELQTDLEALAGPAAGPNGGQIYVDGFSNGQLPPKSAIREIRINQNPFSAEYDKLGYGRIEVFTKPGMEQYHGQFLVNVNNSVLNSRNPLVATMPDYQSEQYSGNFSGPLISKKASFFLNVERRNIADQAVISAIDPNSLQRFSEAIATPRVRTTFSPRIDYQLSPSNTLTARYHYTDNSQQNNGVGQFTLPSQGYSSDDTSQSFQLNDTQIISPTTINETHFQYSREHSSELANEFAPSIQVLGAFLGGGSSIGSVSDHSDRYELQNMTSISHGKHLIKFGGRFRDTREALDSTSGFNGTFTYSSVADYQNNSPSQITITTGNPKIKVNWMDVGLFAQDDWRVRPNLTLSYGLRLESQNGIGDHADVAPRVSLAWGIGRGKRTPKTVLRAGWGVFYDRFTEDLVLRADQLNGINQVQTVSSNNTSYSIDPGLQAPYVMQTAISVERQITKTSTVALTYLNSRGLHQLLYLNTTAPTLAQLAAGIYPQENRYQYESIGIFKQNQLIANFNIRVGSMLSLFGFYSLNYANSDAAGANSYPSNQYDVLADYGRAAFDVRHRLFLGGTISLPHNIRLNPFVMVHSGQPFNITVGQDLNHDSFFNDRPAFAPAGVTLSSTCGPAVRYCSSPWGNFDTQPGPGQKLIPVNYGTGPANFTFNLRVSKTFGLGKKLGSEANKGMGPDGPGGPGGPPPVGHHGGGPGGPAGPGGAAAMAIAGPKGGFGGAANDHRYNLTLSASARNLFNNVNYAAPVGNLSSPLFGLSNTLAGGPFSSGSANRRIELQVLFSF